MKKIGIALDYDGCLLTNGYIFPFNSENIKDIKTNTSIIDINGPLWHFLLTLCDENPDLESLSIFYFSARTSAHTDLSNCVVNESESYFLAMEKVIAHISRILKKSAPKVTVISNKLSMLDIQWEKPTGDTIRKALEDIDYSSEGKGAIKIKQKHDYDKIDDTSKVSLVFAHVHSEELDAYYIFDDVGNIHNQITKYYANNLGASLIPKGVKVVNCHYDNGELKTIYCEITGTGERAQYYQDILRAACKEIRRAERIFPDRFSSNDYEALVRNFYNIFHLQEYFKLTPLQESISDESIHSLVVRKSQQHEHEFRSVDEPTELQQSLLTGFCGFFSKNESTSQEPEIINTPTLS